MLRPATVKDLDAIMVIETATFASDAWSREAMASDIAGAHTHYLVDEGDDGSLVGYAGLLAPRGGHDGDIQTIAVAASRRGAGRGRGLLMALLAEARERGARAVFLEVRADNAVAQRLYAQLGFERIAVRPRYYQPDGVDAWVMRAVL
jgi:ribosomal-protein-alanine acetyltransferase